jgi:hypothetical protein
VRQEQKTQILRTERSPERTHTKAPFTKHR